MKKGFSSLVGMPEFEQVFEENLAFEIKALFSDHNGPNLRNEVSHWDNQLPEMPICRIGICLVVKSQDHVQNTLSNIPTSRSNLEFK